MEVLCALCGVGLLGGAGRADGAAKQWRGGLLRGPPPPGRRVDDAPVLAGARCGTDCIVVPQARAPFDTAPRCGGGNCARVRGILRRQGRGEHGLCGLGSAVRLRLPPGNGGAAGRVGVAAFLAPGGAAGEVPWGRGRGTMAREATMAAVWTDGWGSGSTANDGGGNDTALSAVPSLARATMSWRRGGRQGLGIVGHPTLTQC